MAKEANLVKEDSVISTFTDNKSLFDSCNTTTQVSDRRLRVKLAAIKEMKERGEITIHWIPKEQQLADCLMKRDASNKKLLEVLQMSQLH